MYIIDKLPKKTWSNGNVFGLTFQIDGGGDLWWCSYYSHHLKSTNSSIPSLAGDTIEQAAWNMYNSLLDNNLIKE